LREAQPAPRNVEEPIPINQLPLRQTPKAERPREDKGDPYDETTPSAIRADGSRITAHFSDPPRSADR
jgi:hypothetical protein